MVKSHWNVLVAMAYLRGWASDDLHPHELEYDDDDYQMLITAHAVKPLDTKGLVQ